MKLIRRAVTVRRKLNQLLRIPFRFTNIKIAEREVIYTLPSGSYNVIKDDVITVVEVDETTIVKKSSANIATRIESYKNKQVVRVFVDVEPRFLRAI